MAGFGLWGSMFPIDTVKSKMQVGTGGLGQWGGEGVGCGWETAVWGW